MQCIIINQLVKTNEQSNVVSKIPASFLERQETWESFWRRAPHRKEREAHVLRRSQKREQVLAKKNAAGGASFGSFLRAAAKKRIRKH